MKIIYTIITLAVVIELLNSQPQIKPVRLNWNDTRTVMHINLAVTGNNPYAPFNYTN